MTDWGYVTMSEIAEKILPTLYALSAEDRAYLAHCLLDSLGETEGLETEVTEEEIRAAWEAELNRRVEGIETGKEVGIPAEEVHRLAREILP